MSKRSFNALSPTDCDIVLDAAARSVPVMREKWAKFSEESKAKALAPEMKVTANETDREAFRATVADLVKRETESPVLASLYKRVRDLTG